MKFVDLPVGTKFVDDIALGVDIYDYLTKISNDSYRYDDTLTEWMWCWYDTELYPILEWEDELCF